MLTREEIIKKAKEVANKLCVTSLPRKTFIAKTGISEWQIINLFNSWNEVVIEAGLTPAANIKLEEDELLQDMLDAFLEAKGICPRRKFEKLCRYSTDTYCRRFGRWSKALDAFYKWIEQTGKQFPYMSELVKQCKAISKAQTEENKSVIQNNKVPSYTPVPSSTRYGSFLNFRGLQHAPLNEQGVIFLFGMICFELGYVVEAVKPGFPDCEAKRKIDGRKDHWERVRIEFEYQSKNFIEHGHDATGCDLIVCWEHNWTDCPIEVLELKNIIKELSE